MTGQHIVNQCKLIFSDYGWPETLISDNGPCNTAEVFSNVMWEYNVNHITSSPHYPQSNGLAEKCVQLVKHLVYKVKEEGKDLFKCLMVYCIVKHFVLTNTNTCKQICKIRPSYLKCSQEMTAFRLWELENKVQKWTFTITWSISRPSGHVPRFNKQTLVSSHYNKTVPRTRELHNYNKRGCTVQKNSTSLEAISASRQESWR